MPQATNPEPATHDQLRLLLRLYAQYGLAADHAELAKLTKWQASERIDALRGATVSAAALDRAMLAILKLRAAEAETES